MTSQPRLIRSNIHNARGAAQWSSKSSTGDDVFDLGQFVIGFHVEVEDFFPQRRDID